MTSQKIRITNSKLKFIFGHITLLFGLRPFAEGVKTQQNHGRSRITARGLMRFNIIFINISVYVLTNSITHLLSYYYTTGADRVNHVYTMLLKLSSFIKKNLVRFSAFSNPLPA